MRILAIETSCDETAISVVEFREQTDQIGGTVLSHIISSQIDKHKEWGGVVPNIAKREHQLNLVPLLKQALADSNLLKRETGSSQLETLPAILEREHELLPLAQEFLSVHGTPEIDAIAVTQGPGLEPALWVGLNFAKALAIAWQKPLIPTNHMEGHFFSSLLKTDPASSSVFSVPSVRFPVLGLLISGGHTELIISSQLGHYELMGSTRDDAIGEAFDKVARLLGLTYPGGPEISKLASSYELWVARDLPTGQADSQRATSNFSLPRPMLKSSDFDFSFSGIKTAVRYLVESLPQPLSEETKMRIAYEFETAVTEVVVSKTLKAIEASGANSFIVGGGVIANARIRTELQKQISEKDPAVSIYIPDQKLTTDNATMIAIAAYFNRKQALAPDSPDISSLKASGTLSLHN